MRAPEATPLHCRASEIAHAVRRCDEGSGAVVWLGEPGMGKSGLLAAAARQAAAAGHHVVSVPVAHASAEGASAPSALEALIEQLGAHVVGVTPAPDTGPGSPGRVPDQLTGAGALAAAVTALTRTSGDRTVVFVADDLDLVDPEARAAVITIIVERHARSVLLGSARDPTSVLRLPYEVERRALAPIDVLDALQVLSTTTPGPVAPHVAERLVSELGGAPGAIIETAGLLSTDQLAGLRLIPDPLPAAPSVVGALAPRLTDLDDGARMLLLTAAVSVVDGTETLLRASDTGIDTLVSSPASDHLTMVAGRARITDPRVRSVVHHQASMAQRTEAHARLADAHAADGRSALASWHRALAALAGEAGVVPPLLGVAERMLAHGDAVWAQRVAQEAVAHAGGSARVEALALAGRAALHAGHTVDAVELLRDADHHAPPALRAALRPALVLAATLRTGQVPRVGEPDATTSAQLLAALLHCERGEPDAARTLLAAAAQASSADHDDDHARAFTSACLALLDGDASPAIALDTSTPHAPTRTAMVSGLRALALATCDRVEEARRAVTTALADLAPLTNGCAWAAGDCPDAARASRRYLTPVAEAYLRLAEVLVELWAGSLDAASAALRRAALRAPVMLCMGGAAAVLAGRIDSLQSGEPGVLTRSLERLVPVQPSRAVRVGFLSNRALCLLVTGEHQSATTFFGLVEEESDTGMLGLPGPTRAEAALLGGGRRPAAPPDAARTSPDTPGPGVNPGRGAGSALAASREARSRVAARARSSGDQIDRYVAEALTLSRRLQSPLERGQTRVVVGQALVLCGRIEEGASHLRAAASLFEDCGAHAMAAVARRLLSDAPRPREPDAGAPVERGKTTAMAAGRERPESVSGLVAVASRLTEREREVVEAVVTGASNRVIARRLEVSIRTVEVHLTSIFRKLGVGSRVELALLVMHRDGADRLRGNP